ncbi:MAG TPA: DUF542 domain-containing protein [Herpetosiphonaceae bacterium]
MTTDAVELDLRGMAPRERHPLIFRLLDALKPEQTLLIINDHDPAPLGYQLEATKPGRYGWQYLEQGPETWRVGITRRAQVCAPERRLALAAQTVAACAERDPAAMEVFSRYGIDLCCGGHLTVEQAAAAHGIALETITGALCAVLAPAPELRR